MAVEQLAEHNKNFVFQHVMKSSDITEDEKNAQASKKLKEIVTKQIQEESDAKVKAYEDKVQLTREGWK